MHACANVNVYAWTSVYECMWGGQRSTLGVFLKRSPAYFTMSFTEREPAN